VRQLTPADECNRPGLDSIRYRVGTHGQFFETMKARLSAITVDGVGSDGQTVTGLRPLAALTTRDPDDPSIALLDGWASVGDVLSFYQERIANEGFLRTATERRSVLELSHLIGYTLRPGVASTVYLAYTIDDKQTGPVVIKAGARSQSVPGPGETPQSFETSDDLEARAGWNTLRPRMSRPQLASAAVSGAGVWLQGINTNLKVNDALLIDDGSGGVPVPYRVRDVQPDAASNRTLVGFSAWPAAAASAARTAMAARSAGAAVAESASIGHGRETVDPAVGLMARLTLPPSLPPRGTLSLARSLSSTFTAGADIASQLVAALQPRLQGTLAAAFANEPATAASTMHVYALRARAAPFGNVAPLQITSTTPTVSTTEWGQADVEANESATVIDLDAAYDKILPASWIVIDTGAVDWSNQQAIQLPAGGSTLTVAKAGVVNTNQARAAYGMSGKTTQVELSDASGNPVEWFEFTQPPIFLARRAAAAAGGASTDNTFQLIRRTAVYAQAEELPLAGEPITDAICGGGESWIELDGYYSDLKSGRWVIVSGQRADVTTDDPSNPGKVAIVQGVTGDELVMLSNVVQDIALADGTPSSQFDSSAGVTAPPALPGETLHTFVQFASSLQYCYSRDKVVIYGNVAKATHGETRNEVLGSGDGAQVLQSFTLKQSPLTYVAAPNPAGADSTLHAYVNDVEWHETESLAWLGPRDRGFVTRTDDAGKTALVFGDGQHGARLPTGLLNVRATYRNGIGSPGNVQPGQVSLLQTRPLGVKAVINPMRASGGGDPETRDLARENAPLSVMALDRLVSVRDYADFTRRFAGIAKALAQKTSDGRGELVYLTIAGVDDAPIDPTSDLYRDLLEALRDFGDPDLPIRVDARELQVLVLSANIRIGPDYQWEPVVTAVRAQLLDRFGFGKRSLGQWVLASEVISTIQNVTGVEYVDVVTFGAIPEKVADKGPDGAPIRRLRTPAEIIEAVQLLLGPVAFATSVLTSAFRDRFPRSVRAWPGGSLHGVLVPAGLAIFSPAIPDTLILNQIQ
jgi:hypothetical protein